MAEQTAADGALVSDPRGCLVCVIKNSLSRAINNFQDDDDVPLELLGSQPSYNSNSYKRPAAAVFVVAHL